MLKYDPEALGAPAMGFLADRTDQISAEVGNGSQAVKARALFRVKANKTFTEISHKLRAVSPGEAVGRGHCFYCEHDRNTAIEHIRPLSMYPLDSHSWSNLILACHTCNSFNKNDRFAVIDDAGALSEFRGSDGLAAPPEGTDAFISIRTEQPLNFISLQLSTGMWMVRDGLSRLAAKRAEYTIRVLGLNGDALPRRRLDYIVMAAARLSDRKVAIQAGDHVLADRHLRILMEATHPSVLAELVRQGPTIPWAAPLVDDINVDLSVRSA